MGYSHALLHFLRGAEAGVKTWKLGNGYEVIALQPLALDAVAWQGVFERSLSDDQSRRALIEMYEHLTGRAVNGAGANIHDLRRAVQDTLADAVRNGQLRMVPVHRGGGASSAFNEAEQHAARDLAAEREALRARRDVEERTSKTWVEIELVNQRGKPVGGAVYRLKLPDGTLRQGKLDNDGRIRVPGIDPGTCEICFPDYHGGEWQKI